MVKYVSIDNEKVSIEWFTVLRDMRSDGVAFNVNEGHRTMARQWYFWNLYRSGRGNLAAFPSPFAPHIRTGRIDHAIDFRNDRDVFAWLQRKGLKPRRTVVGESWHIEVPAEELRRYFRAHGDEPTIRRGSTDRTNIIRLQKLLRGLRYTTVVNGRYGIWTRRAVRRFQKKHRLPVDGVVGPRTWAELRKASRKK
jgi:hypothetical protein